MNKSIEDYKEELYKVIMSKMARLETYNHDKVCNPSCHQSGEDQAYNVVLDLLNPNNLEGL